MGGYGALSYAARHPGTFAAAASFSGALEVGSEDAWGERSANEAAGARTCRSRSPRGCGRSRSSSCAPATGGPARSIAAGRSRAARRCALERYLHRSNVRLHARLRALGIRHVWDDYGPGTHDWPYWRRDLRETLPDLDRALARS